MPAKGNNNGFNNKKFEKPVWPYNELFFCLCTYSVVQSENGGCLDTHKHTHTWYDILVDNHACIYTYISVKDPRT